MKIYHQKADLTATQAPAEAARPRTVSGLILPFGEIGYTSAGRVTVTAGAVSAPDDLTRVKLLRDHSDNPQGCRPVGYMTDLREEPEGLYGTFVIPPGDDGDLAVSDIKGHLRDAMSVELVDVSTTAGSVTSATLSAVALVATPAFDAARVTSLNASRKDTEMTNPLDTAVNKLKGAAGTVNSVADEIAGAKQPSTPAEPAADKPAVTAARVPSHLDMLIRDDSREKKVTAALATEAMRFVMSRERVPDSLQAALADVTRSANPAISAPDWLGEMWDGVEFTREIVPTMTTAPLKRMKAMGWVWEKKPQVQDYAGDKKEIPSGQIKTKPVESNAKRLAVGHDIDRAYFDFGETDFIQSYLRACQESYAIESDARAAAFLKESAAKNVGAQQADLIRAAAKARQIVKKSCRIDPSAFLVNSDDYFGLLDITVMDNPEYLKLVGVDPARFIVSDAVEKGTVIAYAKQAATFFELPGSPIRVNAEDLARGGRDTAVFAYYATLLNNPNGIVQVPFKAAGAGA